MLMRLPARELFELVRRVTGAGGTIPVVVEGLSMYPAIEPGATVFIGPLGETLQRGQVLLARKDGQVVLHRLVQQHDKLVLLGDHPHSPAWPLEGVELAGRVTRLRRSRPGRLHWWLARCLDWLTRPAPSRGVRA